MTDPRLERMFAESLAPYEKRRRDAIERTATKAPPMVLTVWQPYAWALICGTKRIENRSRPTAYRGRLLIHAGLGQKSKSGWLDYVTQALAGFPRGCPRPSIDELRETVGHVIGEVTLVDAKANGDHPTDPWAVPGQCGWHVARPRVYTRPFPLRGEQGIFRLPLEHHADLQRAGIKLWYCDDLDVTTDDPYQALVAYQLAGARRLDTVVRINRQPIYFGLLFAEAARWYGEERMAQSLERQTQQRVADREAGQCFASADPWSTSTRPLGCGEDVLR